MRRSALLISLVSSCSLLAGVPASAQPPPASAPQGDTPAADTGPGRDRLAFLGARTRRAVALPLTSDSRRTGKLTVVVRNLSPADGRLRVRFFPAAGRPTVLVGPRRRDGGRVRAQRPRGARVPLPAGELRGVELRFAIPANARVSSVSGLLVADLLLAEKAASRPDPAKMRIRGASPPLRFFPEDISMKVTWGCWLVADVVGAECGRSADVLIRGDYALALLKGEGALGQAVLANGDGGGATLRLDDPRREGNAVRATVSVVGVSGVDRYEGRLPLAPGGRDVAALPIRVTVGHSLALAVLAVFLGALIGGWLARRSGIRRRRTLLGIQVESVLERYDEQLGASGGKAAGYDIEHFLQPRHQRRSAIRPFPGDHGASALLWRIDTAQDDEDFAEATDKTEKFVARIERWIRMEPVARQTRDLVEDVPPKRAQLDFTECLAFRDLETMLEELRTTEPISDEAAEEIRHRLALQGAVLGRWKILWGLHRTLAAKRDWSSEDSERIAGADFPKLDEVTPPLPRSSEQYARLNTRLRNAERRLRGLVDREGLARPPQEAAVRQLLEQLREEAAKPAPLPTGPDSRPSSRHRWGGVVWRDNLWTLVRAFAAVIAYTLTFYDDTWGSNIDYATAFTVGFLTETVVNWAVMPAFQSYRSRRRRASERDSLTDKTLESIEATVQSLLPVRTGNGVPNAPPVQQPPEATPAGGATVTHDPD